MSTELEASVERWIRQAQEAEQRAVTAEAQLRAARADQKQRDIEAVKALTPCPEHLDSDRLRGYARAIQDAEEAIESAEMERGNAEGATD